MATVAIKIQKQGNSFNVSPDPAKVNRGDSVQFDSDTAVRLNFQTNRDWLNLPDQPGVQAKGQSTFTVRGKSEKSFPLGNQPGKKRVTVQYVVAPAAQAQAAGPDPNIYIEEC